MSIPEIIQYLSKGITLTFQLFPLVVLTTLLLGTVLGIIQFRRIAVLSHAIDVYVLFMRGVPPLVVLMLLFFTVNLSSAFLTAYVGLSLYHAAYVTEIIRAALSAIPLGQMEAGQSLAVPYWIIMTKIYLPQIFIRIIPSLCGQYILVVKDTTLVSVVGAQDVMVYARQVLSVTFDPITVYIIVGAIYYILCLLLEWLARYFEKKVVGKHSTTSKPIMGS